MLCRCTPVVDLCHCMLMFVMQLSSMDRAINTATAIANLTTLESAKSRITSDGDGIGAIVAVLAALLPRKSSSSSGLNTSLLSSTGSLSSGDESSDSSSEMANKGGVGMAGRLTKDQQDLLLVLLKIIAQICTIGWTSFVFCVPVCVHQP